MPVLLESVNSGQMRKIRLWHAIGQRVERIQNSTSDTATARETQYYQRPGIIRLMRSVVRGWPGTATRRAAIAAMHSAKTCILQDAGWGGATCGAMQRNNSSTDEILRELLTVLKTPILWFSFSFHDTNIIWRPRSLQHAEDIGLGLEGRAHFSP